MNEIAIPLLLVRLIGLGFAAHGAQKLFGWFGGYGLAGTGGFFESLGFRPGRFFAGAAGVGELLGGLLIAFGLGGPIGSMLAIAVMVVAILSVHLSHGFFASNNGYELPLAYIGWAFILAFTGFGPYSLDAVLGLNTLWTLQIAWIAVLLGVLGGLANMALRRKAPPAPAAAGEVLP
ncbi:MAG TPA: DoxX family protein [Candidatus Elarobacter sp.]